MFLYQLFLKIFILLAFEIMLSLEFYCNTKPAYGLSLALYGNTNQNFVETLKSSWIYVCSSRQGAQRAMKLVQLDKKFNKTVKATDRVRSTGPKQQLKLNHGSITPILPVRSRNNFLFWKSGKFWFWTDLLHLKHCKWSM